LLELIRRAREEKAVMKWRWPKIDERVLRKLCSRLELSDTAIGQQFGVTREAIRLARNRFGITGRGRERLKVIQERARRLSEKRSLQHIYDCNPYLRQIKREAAKYHTAFELLMWPPFGHWISLANRVCYLSRVRTYEHKRTKLSYVVIQRPRTDLDFNRAVFKLPRGWMVLPPDNLPKVSTAFVVGRKKRKANPGKKSNRRDWGNYYYSSWDWLCEFSDGESRIR
jgi:hypothetical protein